MEQHRVYRENGMKCRRFLCFHSFPWLCFSAVCGRTCYFHCQQPLQFKVTWMVSLQPWALHKSKMSFFAATPDFSFEFGTKFRLQGRLLRRILTCVTAASAKSEFQRKQAEKQNFNTFFLQGNSTTIGCSSMALLCDFKLKVSVLELDTLWNMI